MGKYISFGKKAFQRCLAYRIEYFLSIFNGLLWVYFFVSIWRALYAGEETLFGIPRVQQLTYAVIAMVLKIAFTMDEFMVEKRVRMGDVATDLMKPIDFQKMVLADSVGVSLFNSMARGVPILIFCMFTVEFNWPQAQGTFLLFIASAACAYGILFGINYLVSLLAFWFTDIFGFQLLKWAAMTTFSGFFLPYWHMPAKLFSVMVYLPLMYIFYVPAGIFAGRITGAEAVAALIVQALWVLLLWFVGRCAWGLASRKLTVHGG